jgi:hypothetical protein
MLETLTKNERRYLARRSCLLCEQRLDRDSCGSLFGPRCTPEFLADRRARCLAEYRPHVRLVADTKPAEGEV